jgi:putative flippase GtrA
MSRIAQRIRLGMENERHRAHAVQFIRFLFVGMFNTLVGYGLFVLFSLMDVKTSYALALAYVFGALCNFFTTGRLVFGTSNAKFLLRFLLVYVVIYGINLGGITLLMGIGIPKLYAQAICVPFMAVLSFLAFKLFAFKGVSQ